MASKSKKPSSKPPLPPRQNMNNNGGPQNNGPTCMNPDMASMNGYIGQQGQIVPSQIPVQQIPSPQHVPPVPIQGYSAAAFGNIQNDCLQGQGQVYQHNTTGYGQYNMATHVNSNGNSNGTIVSMIEQMNNNFCSRLSNIETSLTKLTTIEREVAFVRSDVYQLQTDNTNLSRRMSEVEKSCQLISSCFDESKTLHINLQKEMSELKKQNSVLTDKIKSNFASNESLSNELSELKARSMQQNLLFFGICEPPNKEKEYIEPKIKDFMKHELDLEDPSIVDSIVFDRIHRLGRPNNTPGANPRPVVARFERYKDREVIREAAKDLNSKRNGYSIREQYPPEMEAKRRLLYPVMRQMQQNSQNRVALVRDKLFVNNDLYTVHKNETGDLTVKIETQRGEAGISSSRRIVRGVRNPTQTHPQGPPPSWAQGANSFMSQGTGMYQAPTHPQGPPPSWKQGTHSFMSQGAMPFRSQFESANMYRTLDGIDEDSRTLSRKHQASSPAFDDRTQKKTREENEPENMEHVDILDLDEGTVTSKTSLENDSAFTEAAGNQPVDHVTGQQDTTQTVTVNSPDATDIGTSSTPKVTHNDSRNSVSQETAI